MSAVYFTITGINYRWGKEIFEKGTRVKITKEPDNEHDTEAIKAEMPGLGTVGYVANSVRTRIGESSSAGRIYGMFGESAEGEVLYVLDAGILCELKLDSEE